MLRTEPLPIMFEPCIPATSDRLPSGPGWVHEIKHDGFRLMVYLNITGVRLVTRNGHDWADRYPTVAAAVATLHCRSCVIDGEVAICDEHGRAIFDRLQQGPRVKPEAILLAFDLLELDGRDLRREPLEVHKATLLSLLNGAPVGVQYVERRCRRPSIKLDQLALFTPDILGPRRAPARSPVPAGPVFFQTDRGVLSCRVGIDRNREEAPARGGGGAVVRKDEVYRSKMSVKRTSI